MPTELEWDKIDDDIETLRSMCDEEFIHHNRERLFVMSLKSSNNLALYFLVICITSLIIAACPPVYTWIRYVCYIFWLISVGGLGSIAFITVNVLAIHNDATFDLSSNTLIRLRILLGCLSALVISMPFGAPEFFKFMKDIDTGVASATSDLLLLMLPFILGFSTSFLMTILKRIGEGLQVVFGEAPQPITAKGQNKDTSASAGSAGSSPARDDGGSRRIGRGSAMGQTLPAGGHRSDGGGEHVESRHHDRLTPHIPSDT